MVIARNRIAKTRQILCKVYMNVCIMYMLLCSGLICWSPVWIMCRRSMSQVGLSEGIVVVCGEIYGENIFLLSLNTLID
jgi:hypothetical protein